MYNEKTKKEATFHCSAAGFIDSIDDVSDIIERVMKEAETAIKNNHSMLK